MSKRNAEQMGASDTKRKKKRIEDLVFLFFTAALCGGLCQGCDLCHPEACEPEEANAIEKGGIIYKRVGHGFDLTFASLTCMFIRMHASFEAYTTPTAKDEHNGRSLVQITDDNGNRLTSLALKFASLAWGNLTPARLYLRYTGGGPH